MYICMRCGKNVELDSAFRRIRCPFCGYKILVKKRSPAMMKTVKAQ